jgi:hypothetical protein
VAPDYPDLVEPAYILFDGEGGGQLAFGCVSGTINAAGNAASIAFDWNGCDEMDEAHGDGWAELQPDGSLEGRISFCNGDDADFIASPWTTSSTACQFQMDERRG